eukprot:GHUV01035204.1.p1 GENE.GHUV01035204.1~~GHUV01035204.1.p1  ORF type:complete len:153 (-),score=18.67 GHUV01035204.1:650-1108(-)
MLRFSRTLMWDRLWFAPSFFFAALTAEWVSFSCHCCTAMTGPGGNTCSSRRLATTMTIAAICGAVQHMLATAETPSINLHVCMLLCTSLLLLMTSACCSINASFPAYLAPVWYVLFAASYSGKAIGASPRHCMLTGSPLYPVLPSEHDQYDW